MGMKACAFLHACGISSSFSTYQESLYLVIYPRIYDGGQVSIYDQRLMLHRKRATPKLEWRAIVLCYLLSNEWTFASPCPPFLEYNQSTK